MYKRYDHAPHADSHTDVRLPEMLICSVRTHTTELPVSNCLAMMLLRRPRRCPRQSTITGLVPFILPNGGGACTRLLH